MQVKDQLGYILDIPSQPLRIISLVPSQTALLHNLGLDQRVVGITKFCKHPAEWQNTKTIVGGTKKIEISRILELGADLVMANKEENTKEQIEQLRRHVPVWVSDVVTIEDALTMITEIGMITARETAAAGIVQRIRLAFEECPLVTARCDVLYLIWRNPWMAAGPNTFINSVLTSIGMTNVVKTPRYPALTPGDMQRLQPDLVILPTEPFPFKPSHLEEIKALLPEAKPMLVEGEWFSWYGSHLLRAVDYFKTLGLQSA